MIEIIFCSDISMLYEFMNLFIFEISLVQIRITWILKHDNSYCERVFLNTDIVFLALWPSIGSNSFSHCKWIKPTIWLLHIFFLYLCIWTREIFWFFGFHLMGGTDTENWFVKSNHRIFRVIWIENGAVLWVYHRLNKTKLRTHQQS